MNALTMRGRTVCFLAILAAISGTVRAQQAVSIPEGNASGATEYYRGFKSNPYSAQPPSLLLIPSTPGARQGGVWLRSDKSGLYIWGQVDGGEPDWPEQKREILAKDHIEVWLAAETDVPMPPIGWGNQFAWVELKSRDDCKKPPSHDGKDVGDPATCEQWYTDQIHYRSRFKRLFLRQWLIAENHVVEAYASAAYSDLRATLFNEFLPAALEPKGIEQIQTGTRATPDKMGERPTGYGFYVFIPYGAFPPTRQLELRDLLLMVDVFSPAPEGKKMGAYSSTSATREWGNPASFNHVRLDPPRRFALSPCQSPLQEADLYDRKYPAWFFPAQASDHATIVSADYIAANPAEGYMYGPGGVSPQFRKYQHFWKPLQDGAWICGPPLTWRKDDVVKKARFVVDEEWFDARPLPDGWSLARSGPSASTQSRFASGQCGAATVASLDMYAISPAGEISQAFKFSHVLRCFSDDPQAADFEISPDWQRITIYQFFTESGKFDARPHWDSTTYCLEDHAYQRCAESKDATPPNPPNFPEFQ